MIIFNVALIFQYKILLMWYLRTGTHCRKGSPVKPSRQAQDAVWSRQVHTAPRPHMLPRLQGSTQCWLMQAWWGPQSLFSTHSGRHPWWGSPTVLGRQEQTALPASTWHKVFSPQGLGMHGLPIGTCSEKKKQEFSLNV